MSITVGLCKKLGIEFVRGDEYEDSYGIRNFFDEKSLNYLNSYINKQIAVSFNWRKGPIPEQMEYVDVRYICTEKSQIGICTKKRSEAEVFEWWKPNMQALEGAADLATAVILTPEMSDKIQELCSGESSSEWFGDDQIGSGIIDTENEIKTLKLEYSDDKNAVFKNGGVEVSKEEFSVYQLAKNLNVDLKELANKVQNVNS